MFRQLKEEINDLNNKKQELDNRYLESASLLNYLNVHTSYSIEIFNQIFNGMNKKIMITPYLIPIFMNFMYTGNKDEEKEEENKWEKD